MVPSEQPRSPPAAPVLVVPLMGNSPLGRLLKGGVLDGAQPLPCHIFKIKLLSSSALGLTGESHSSSCNSSCSAASKKQQERGEEIKVES